MSEIEKSKSEAETAAPLGKVSSAELEKLPPEMKVMASMFLGVMRSTTGPDPETARLLAQTEMHEESCRLEGYKESLKNRDTQNQRDHDFRVLRAKQNNANVKAILCVGFLGCAGGIALFLTGHQTVGSDVLLASAFAVFGVLSGKTPFNSSGE